FSSTRRHTRFSRDWSSDVCSSDLNDYQIRYTYTEGGLQAERVFDGWDEEIGDWIFDFLTTWTYNEQGLPGEVTDSSWDPLADGRSEERRVGKQCRGGCAAGQETTY